VSYGAVETERMLSMSLTGSKQKRVSNGEGGRGTGITAALVRQLQTSVGTECGHRGTSVSVGYLMIGDRM
jgi:hypothetical protein